MPTQSDNNPSKPTPGELTLEQQFKLQSFKNTISTISIEQARDYLYELMRQSIVKDNLVKHLLKQDLTDTFYNSPNSSQTN